jgi:hypothetical protein
MRFIRELPLRVATGAFILNSGLSKRHLDTAHADRVHGMAAQAYPFLKRLRPTTFAGLLSSTEIALGTALLLPVVPDWLAGLGLGAFSGGLLGLYERTPGLHPEGSVRPTEQGLPIAKDVWMFAIALSLLAESMTAALSKSD